MFLDIRCLTNVITPKVIIEAPIPPTTDPAIVAAGFCDAGLDTCEADVVIREMAIGVVEVVAEDAVGD